METIVTIAFVLIMTISAMVTFKVLQASIDAELAREQDGQGNCLSCGHKIHAIGQKS